MELKLKLAIRDAIDDVINKAAESSDELWDELIHHTLVNQMTDAAALVFDAAQDSQKFMRGNAA